MALECYALALTGRVSAALRAVVRPVKKIASRLKH